MGDITGGKGGNQGNQGTRTANQQAQGIYSWAAPIMQQGLNMQTAMQDAYYWPMRGYAQGQPFGTPLGRPFSQGAMNVQEVPLNYDVSQMPEYAGYRASQIQPYQQAQQSIMANTPRGGAQQQALANLSVQQAAGLDQARAGLNAQQRAITQQNNLEEMNKRWSSEMMQRQFEAQELARAQSLIGQAYGTGVPMFMGAAGMNTNAAMAQQQADQQAKGAMGQGIGTLGAAYLFGKGGKVR